MPSATRSRGSSASTSEWGSEPMRSHTSNGLVARIAVRALLGGALIVGVGCSDILNVKNPNDVAEDALQNPASAPNQANGVLASAVRMLMAVTTPYSEATDELDW